MSSRDRGRAAQKPHLWGRLRSWEWRALEATACASGRWVPRPSGWPAAGGRWGGAWMKLPWAWLLSPWARPEDTGCGGAESWTPAQDQGLNGAGGHRGDPGAAAALRQGHPGSLAIPDVAVVLPEPTALTSVRHPRSPPAPAPQGKQGPGGCPAQPGTRACDPHKPVDSLCALWGPSFLAGCSWAAQAKAPRAQ